MMIEEWIPVEKPPLGKVRDLNQEQEITFQYTQVIVVRSDIKMSKGKLAVQVAHASVGTILCNVQIDDFTEYSDIVHGWLKEGQRKIVVAGKDVEHLQMLQSSARSLDIPNFLVTDFGLTEFSEPTITCLGLGPCKIEHMNLITKDLPLLKN